MQCYEPCTPYLTLETLLQQNTLLICMVISRVRGFSTWTNVDQQCCVSVSVSSGVRAWAARYDTWLLIKLTPRSVVQSFLFSCFSSVTERQCRTDLRKKHASRSCPTGCTPSGESQHSGGCPGPACPPCHDPKCTSLPCGSLVQHASGSQPPVTKKEKKS
jgi:hypothetical protein